MAIPTPDARQIQQTIAGLVSAAVTNDEWDVLDSMPDKVRNRTIAVDFPDFTFDDNPADATMQVVAFVAPTAGTDRAQERLAEILQTLIPALASKTGTGVCATRVLATQALTREEIAAYGYWGARLILRINLT